MRLTWPSTGPELWGSVAVSAEEAALQVVEPRRLGQGEAPRFW